MDPPNVDVDVQVLVLFLGVEHTVVSYYVTESETWGELEDGCYAFRDRLERLRNLSQYQSDEYKLEFWVDEKCCEGRDVLDHPVVRIFGLPTSRSAFKCRPTPGHPHILRATPAAIRECENDCIFKDPDSADFLIISQVRNAK